MKIESFSRIALVLGVGLTLILSSSLAGITVISSSNWYGPDFPAEKTVDNIFGYKDGISQQAYFGIPLPGNFVTYDLGTAQIIRKIRITPVTYGGTPPVTYGAITGTIMFSKDNVTWSSAVSFSVPAMESIIRWDMGESGLDVSRYAKYIRMTFNPYVRIAEIIFLTGPKLAVYELAQNTKNTNSYPSWLTADGNLNTFGAGINSEGSIVYDQGSSQKVCGFTMWGRADTGSVNPTSGQLWVSDSPDSDWQLVESWTLPSLSAGSNESVTFSVANAKTGRYVKLANLSGGNQWAEFEVSTALIHNEQVDCEIVLPDNSTYVQACPDICVTDPPDVFAAKELRDHILKATSKSLAISKESDKSTTCSSYIYLGACNATTNAGITTANYDLKNNECIIERKGNDLYILGLDSAEQALGSNSDPSQIEYHILHENQTKVGTLMGAYDYLRNQMKIRWLWPGEIGKVVPSTTNVFVGSNIDRIVKPKFIHSRLREYGQTYLSMTAWSSEINRNNFLDNQMVWLRRNGFCRGMSVDVAHSFTDWWARFGPESSNSHRDYFNKLPIVPELSNDGNRMADPYYWGGETTFISMCLSNPGLQNQKVADWAPSDYAPIVDCSENDTAIKCTCEDCMGMDEQDGGLSASDWSNRLENATSEFNAMQPGWESKLGSMSDRQCKYLLSVQTLATEARPGFGQAIVAANAYANYSDPPIATTLNNNVWIAIVPPITFPWTQSLQEKSTAQINGWHAKGATIIYRPNYTLDGHNYPIFFAHRFGEVFADGYEHGVIATDFDSLTGQWGIQAPNWYMIGRMNTDVGNLTPEQILDEFYSAFGPAKNKVQEYFDYMKDVSDSISDADAASAGANFSNFYQNGRVFFPQSVRDALRTKMNAAIAAASGNVDASEKVEFLNKGLTHFEKTIKAGDAWQSWIDNGTPPEIETGPLAWNAVIADLDDYRAAIEADGTSNFCRLRSMEDFIWPRSLPHTVNVTAGNLISLHGDDVCIPSAFVAAYNRAGTEIYLVLDLLSAQNVDKIKYINPIMDSNYVAKDLSIFVAQDESPEILNKYNKACYTRQVFTGSLYPDVNTANTERYADILDVRKRYFLLKITSNFWGTVGDVSNAQYIFAGDIDKTTAVSEPVLITAGSVRGLSSDTMSNFTENGQTMIRGSNGVGEEIYIRLDLGQVKNISRIKFVNRYDMASNLNIRNTTIYVAPDENTSFFDPGDISDFTSQVFNDNLSPDNNMTGSARYADIVDSPKRYVLIKVDSNFWGTINLQGDRRIVDFGDIDIETYIPVAAGSVRGLSSDTMSNFTENGYTMIRGSNGAGTEIYMRLDLGQVKNIDKIKVHNRYDMASNLNMRNMTIYVADENYPSFDSESVSCYTDQVFDGNLSPDSNAAGAAREADIVNRSKRYILIRVNSNFWGTINLQGDRSIVDAGDIDIVAY